MQDLNDLLFGMPLALSPSFANDFNLDVRVRPRAYRNEVNTKSIDPSDKGCPRSAGLAPGRPGRNGRSFRAYC